MTHETHNSSRPADALTRHAIDRAKLLLASSPEGESALSWSPEAAHVGDLSVLLLTLVD